MFVPSKPFSSAHTVFLCERVLPVCVSHHEPSSRMVVHFAPSTGICSDVCACSRIRAVFCNSSKQFCRTYHVHFSSHIGSSGGMVGGGGSGGLGVERGRLVHYTASTVHECI